MSFDNNQKVKRGENMKTESKKRKLASLMAIIVTLITGVVLSGQSTSNDNIQPAFKYPEQLSGKNEWKPGTICIDFRKAGKEAVKESMIPVRPGIPGKMPFWNSYSRQFIYAPSFDLKNIEGAKKYKFTVTAGDTSEYSFIADKPWADLSPVWTKIPVGFVSLKVQGIDDEGKPLGLAGFRKFYKASCYQGPYHQKVLDYGYSAKRALEYVYNQAYIQNWRLNAAPDSTYDLYCYPSKIIGAVVGNMLVYGKLFPADAGDALAIAKNAANYLISISEPQGGPLEYFPPTYRGEARVAKQFKYQFMTIYPADVAGHYLDLFDVTGDSTYYHAAVHIADTYLKLQLPSGTWMLKLWKSGEPVSDNVCIPLPIVKLFDRLMVQYRSDKYQQTRDKAFNWIMDNPIRTYSWAGQFEDNITHAPPYKNMTEHQACEFAMYLLDRVGENPGYKDIAEELVRFSEDQFLVWEKPMPQEGIKVDEWITPCGLEQYGYYVPIDASASKFIETFLKAWQVTGKKLYLVKATELANTMTVAQISETGRYPTYWENNDKKLQEGWLNCTLFDVRAMLKIAEFTNQ